MKGRIRFEGATVDVVTADTIRDDLARVTAQRDKAIDALTLCVRVLSGAVMTKQAIVDALDAGRSALLEMRAETKRGER